MKTSKHQKSRGNRGESPHNCSPVEQTISSPELKLPKLWGNLKKKERFGPGITERTPRDGGSASESNLPSRQNELLIQVEEKAGKGDDRVSDETPENQGTSSSGKESMSQENFQTSQRFQALWKADRLEERYPRSSKKSRSCSPSVMDFDDPLTRQIRDVHNNTRKSARIIRDSRARLLEIQKKSVLTEADVKELGERNELLLREMDHFDRLTRNIQKLVGAEVAQLRKLKDPSQKSNQIPISVYEPAINHEMKMTHPTVLLAGGRPFGAIDQPTRSKSEIDLSRKLSESYDMQEKLVADNADLEVKRYVLYKELMTKDQNLEICRAQIKRLQGELKLIHKENTTLQEKLSKNNPQGDATAIIQDNYTQYEIDVYSEDEEIVRVKNSQELISKLQYYQTYTEEIGKEVGELEYEIRNLRVEMDSVKAGGACRGGGGVNTCFEQPPGGPPVPPMTRATPAEREVQKLTIQLRQTEENFKTKVTECAMLRADVLRKKEELEKERCQHREVQNKLRELEMKFEGLATTTNMALGSKEQAFEQEVNVRALKQCYREAREEIDELRLLMKEQNDQLQDYRVKYLHAQQLVEEQRRQMDMMDMDNTRISEQINLEIQKVKIKFQEKLQELAPIPDLLKATQIKLKDAQQSQAIAEHNAEQLARELNSAREKVHVLLHNSLKPPEKPPEKGGDEKQIALLQQRITQLTETNMSFKNEIERLKGRLLRMEESILANEKRLQEKMHECAELGGNLDRARDMAARALQRATERTETIRKCMQTTVAELERQLASTRAQVKTIEKQKEELQSRMQCQIKRLNENFEQAQLRILGLQTQLQSIRRTASSTGEGEGDGEQQECACSTFFDNP